MDPSNKKKPGDPGEPLAAWPADLRAGRDVPASLGPDELARLVPYAPQWRIVPRHGVPRLHRSFACRSFSEAMWLTLKIGEVAEAAGLRPTILTESDHVTVSLRTPDVGGPHRNDFNVAFQIDSIYDQRVGAARRSDA